MKNFKLFNFDDYAKVFGNREKSNKIHLEFNQTIASTINTICEPLSSFGITMFNYSRIFNGGSRLYITSNLQWSEHYITQEFHDEIDHLAHYVPPDGVKYAFWSGFRGDRVFDALAEHNLGNGFSIYEKHKDYVDYFDFSADKDNNQIVNLYMNKIDLLLRFIEYFKEQIFLLIDFEDKKNILIPKKFISFDKVPREENSTLEALRLFSKTCSGNEEMIFSRGEHPKLMDVEET